MTTETLKAENPNKTPTADTDQSSLAVITHSHSASERNSQSKSWIKNGRTESQVTKTLTIRNSILLSKTHQNSVSNSNLSPRPSTDIFYHRKSMIKPSSSFIKETISERIKVSLSKKNRKSTILTQSVTTGILRVETSNPVTPTRSLVMTSSGSPVPPMISVVMTSSSNPVSPTRSLVLTTSSSTVEMNGGKDLKLDSFVVVFFPTVVFMMAVGVGICIKMRQK